MKWLLLLPVLLLGMTALAQDPNEDPTEVYIGGDGTVIGDVKLSVGQKLILDGNNDYIWVQVDGNMDFYITNGLRFRVTSSMARFYVDLSFYDNSVLMFGTGNDFKLEFDTGQTTDAMLMGLDSTSRTLLIMEESDMGTDFGHSAQTNPTIIGHSADATDTSQWWSVAHDQTSGVMASGKGGFKFDDITGHTPSGDQSLAAGDTLTASNGIMRVAGNGGAVASTADPTVAAGAFDGTCIIIQGTSDVNTWEAQDEAQNAGSTLELAGSVDMVLGQGDTLQLCWDSGDSKWYEISRSNN